MERSELDSGSGNGHDLRELASGKLEDVKEWSSDLLERAEAFVRERPGTAMLVALGAGFIFGRIVRRI